MMTLILCLPPPVLGLHVEGLGARLHYHNAHQACPGVLLQQREWDGEALCWSSLGCLRKVLGEKNSWARGGNIATAHQEAIAESWACIQVANGQYIYSN